MVNGCANLLASLASVEPYMGSRHRCRDYRNKLRLPSLSNKSEEQAKRSFCFHVHIGGETHGNRLRSTAEEDNLTEGDRMVERMHVRVLIVDDQPRARQSLKALLATWLKASEIQEVSSGHEALYFVEESRPDVILMDARMPGMDGLEATRLIKTGWPEVKIVVLSMYPDYKGPALAAGADAFVCKGELPERLLTILSAVVSGHK
jgi:CheY-like chemotaxis protein